MTPTFQISEEDKIKELLTKAPGSYFSLADSAGTVLIPAAFYKTNRNDFWERVKMFLNSDLAITGFYSILNGSTRKVRPLFLLQKGNPDKKPEIIMTPQEKPNIELVKENAELKAELAYLKLRMSELEEDLEEETDLAEQVEEEKEKKPSIWESLAEQLLPLAAPIASALIQKLTTPENEIGRTQQTPVGMQNPRTNVKPVTGNVQYRRPSNSVNLQSDDYTRPDLHGYNPETQNQTIEDDDNDA
jgi:hypothetical protein